MAPVPLHGGEHVPACGHPARGTHSRGVDGLLRALREERGAIKHDLDTRMDWENFSQSVGWEKIFVSSVVSEANQPCVGRASRRSPPNGDMPTPPTPPSTCWWKSSSPWA